MDAQKLSRLRLAVRDMEKVCAKKSHRNSTGLKRSKQQARAKVISLVREFVKEFKKITVIDLDKINVPIFVVKGFKKK